MSSLLLSIDVGTSGVRAALFNERAEEVARVRSRRAVTKVSDFAELDADLIVNEVVRTVDELLISSSYGQIEFIAISAFWHSLIGVDADGRPTTQLMTWADTRAAQYATDLSSRLDERENHSRTGCRFHSSYWPAKLEW